MKFSNLMWSPFSLTADHKKLPFMAMLRNIRNMMKAGVSEKHHQWVIGKLTDEGAVVHSKQFPFRFFSAYTVLDELEADYTKHRKHHSLDHDPLCAPLPILRFCHVVLMQA